MIADTLAIRRVPGNMENRFALLTGSASAQTGNDLVNQRRVVHHGMERGFLGFHVLLKGLSRSEGAWKSVEDEPAAAMQAAVSFAYQVPDGGVRHEPAPVHVVNGSHHGGRLVAFRAASGSAKDVARG